MDSKRNLGLVYAAAFLRSASVGLLGVILAVYLARIGFTPAEIGFVLAAGLVGSALPTAAVSRYGERFGRRRVLIAAAIISACGGVALALVHSPAALIALGFACMLNGMGTDRSVAFAVEQAIIPGLVPDRARTWALSWYNVVLDLSGALGALAGALPVAIAAWRQIEIITAYRWVFLSYTALNLAAVVLYLLLDAQVDLVVMAGFMRILKGDFLRTFPLRVVNIHPSLLPAFPGLEAWKQALDYGVKVTGCTVHYVDQGVDSGPIIGQETVPVLPNDSPASLHERIQQAERRLYPLCVAALANGRVVVKGRETVWLTS